jgi:hypothetical protein
MTTKAPPRGALCGRAYLAELPAIELIGGLKDAHVLLNAYLLTIPTPTVTAGRITRAANALIRVVLALEDALGSSADE